jgi:hypothetical protein
MRSSRSVRTLSNTSSVSTASNVSPRLSTREYSSKPSTIACIRSVPSIANTMYSRISVEAVEFRRQQFDVTGDHPQGFLQVTREDVGESLEPFVRRFDFAFALLALSDVTPDAGDAVDGARRVVQRPTGSDFQYWKCL